MIARQRLRLPYRFCYSQVIWSTIHELEEQNRKLSNWQMSPWLRGKMILLFDKNGEAKIGKYSLSYDSEYGLQYEERRET